MGKLGRDGIAPSFKMEQETVSEGDTVGGAGQGWTNAARPERGPASPEPWLTLQPTPSIRADYTPLPSPFCFPPPPVLTAPLRSLLLGPDQDNSGRAPGIVRVVDVTAIFAQQKPSPQKCQQFPLYDVPMATKGKHPVPERDSQQSSASLCKKGGAAWTLSLQASKQHARGDGRQEQQHQTPGDKPK
ncbi:hypothetical protein JZ751_002428 [Albula glossodonta]|uniref:Uncharacterized protein n=1 Tax=Albula glossodonta TaxID=121402 RepID=A0A8T2NBC5_9TELE|nr:hypothetical protein JZ751_002428 [Albula glossodonta]